ncbi:hypothetical protein ASF21_12745 [Arthrobacter sp. Leaf234]|uniref:hypothetical protein n=1 Tax=Arthrobacter sp. Leaf234 TaxID=1736303 RepID=UPI0006F7737C|nr:hypothetical protein [Arthrobacter sp. Leaf234]KQN99669.1 hypothetical protein ASF21_12745 [Arthrobacter sp. Leaf234]
MQAIAELSAALNAFILTFDAEGEFNPRREFISLETAFIKLRLSGTETVELADIIDPLSALLPKLAIKFNDPKTPAVKQGEIREVLTHSVAVLVQTLIEWPTDTPKMRQMSLVLLEGCVRSAKSTFLDVGGVSVAPSLPEGVEPLNRRQRKELNRRRTIWFKKLQRGGR